MNKIPIVIIDKEEKNIDKILSTLELFEEAGRIRYSNDIYDLELLLARRIPTVVIIGPTYNFKNIEEMLKHYNNSLNHVRIVMLAKEISAELLRSAIKLNVHDIIEYPIQEKDLKDSFKRASSIFEAVEEPDSKNERTCAKIMFFSTKGGAGNTFLSVNFAIALKLKIKKEVAIYDLNYQFGDVALVMNIYPKNTIFDLMTVNKYDDENLDVFLIRHNSGVRLLPAPIDPSQGEAIKADTSVKVLEGMSRINDYIIIDAPSGFNDEVLAFLEKMDYIFLVATKDVPSVKNLKICLQLLERLNYPREKTFIVLNRADSKVDIEFDEIEKTIQRKIDIKIPSDRIVPISINKGIPAIFNAPRSPISKNIVKMLDFIITKEKKPVKLKN
ncbi:MAG: hypothetical protein FJW66_02155 [Actinobacteria bacterium]|nr:hypothetical protein [Actinomycetota bacterium]